MPKRNGACWLCFWALVGLMIGGCTAPTPAPSTAPVEAAPRKIKVLVYGGGVIHDFNGIHKVVMEILGACPQLELISVTDELTPPPPAEPGKPAPRPGVKSAIDEMLAKLPECDVLFFHHTGGKLTEQQENALCGAIASGKGFVGIHSAADSFKQNAKYMDMLGGMFRTHPAPWDIPATVLDPTHPIMKDVPKEFTVHDEQYILKYDPAKVHVLVDAPYKLMKYNEVVEKDKDGKEVKKRVLTNEVQEEGRMPAVWTKPWEKGRVVYISFCHDSKATANEVVRKIVLQAVLWVGTPTP